jgi:hypothetical protein
MTLSTVDKTIKFDFVFLGQCIIRYPVPPNIFKSINTIYEQKMKEKKLPSWESQLIGKIPREHSLFYNGNNPTKNQKKRHNFLNSEILGWFEFCFNHYLQWNHITKYQIKLSSAWINEMKKHAYNPTHTHSGDLLVGLSSVMFLKIPKDMGPEYTRSDEPMNGQLFFSANGAGQFAKLDFTPDQREGTFLVFPYDLRHSVYPMNQSKEIRRTLSCNCDVLYDPKHQPKVPG